MSRGNRQDRICLDDRDCEICIDTLGEACTKTGWLVHAFVLMGNHYHLLIETPEANLVAGMKWLQGTYTQRFNSRHKLWGHLLQGRYKALPVDGSEGNYFSTLGNYVHLNPARARLFDLNADHLESYRWSSYPLYFQPSKRPEWLVVDRVLGALGVLDDGPGRAWYRAYMQKRVSEIFSGNAKTSLEDEWAKIRRGWFVGSVVFQDDLTQKIGASVKDRQRESFGGAGIKAHDVAEAERLCLLGLATLGLDPVDLPDMAKGAPEKAVLAWLLRAHTTVDRSWVARRLAMGAASRVTKLAPKWN